MGTCTCIYGSPKFTSTEYYNEHVVAYWTTIVFSSYGL